MKERLLALLVSRKGEIISGEVLSNQLGISRVSVWKHIKGLQERGYPIQSGPKGYVLVESDDALFPWEFPGRESSIRYFEELDSTMTKAKEGAREGCPHFTVVVAGQQNKGRGRLQRTWVSDKGGLYFTLILKPAIPAALVSRYSFAASFCLASVLREDFGIDARVKWPNDILVDEKKLSGMLCEMEMESDLVSFLNIGIGLNVNNNPGKQESGATSMKELLGRPVPRKEVLGGFLDRMEEELDKPSLDHIIPQWKKIAVTLKRQVKIVTTTETCRGVAVDIDENGALLLKQSDDSILKVYYGDCFHQVWTGVEKETDSRLDVL